MESQGGELRRGDMDTLKEMIIRSLNMGDCNKRDTCFADREIGNKRCENSRQECKRICYCGKNDLSIILSRSLCKGFPMELLDLTSITRIDLSHNNISVIPREIGKLKNLTRLALGHNQIVCLPDEIGLLNNLRWLDLTSNKLLFLPETIGHLTNLTGLGLSECYLSHLPSSIGSLKRLVKFGIYNNRLIRIPKEIVNLSNLVKLDLSNNGLVELPDDIDRLSSLTWLNLSHNSLQRLPDSLANMKGLQELGLGQNRLSSIPNLSSLKELVILPIYKNKLTKIEDWISEMVSLRKLDLSYNEIEYVHENLFRMKNLVYLNLRKNKLKILNIPMEGFLSSLETIDIFGNRLVELPSRLISIKSLLTCRLGDNNWMSLPPKIKPRMITLKRVLLKKICKDYHEHSDKDRRKKTIYEKIANSLYPSLRRSLDVATNGHACSGFYRCENCMLFFCCDPYFSHRFVCFSDQMNLPVRFTTCSYHCASSITI